MVEKLAGVSLRTRLIIIFFFNFVFFLVGGGGGYISPVACVDMFVSWARVGIWRGSVTEDSLDTP